MQIEWNDYKLRQISTRERNTIFANIFHGGKDIFHARN